LSAAHCTKTGRSPVLFGASSASIRELSNKAIHAARGAVAGLAREGAKLQLTLNAPPSSIDCLVLARDILGREPIKPERLAEIRFDAHFGLK
jgi:hypothetical protein